MMTRMDGHPGWGSEDPPIGEIAQRREVVRDALPCVEVDAMFRADPAMRSVVAASDDGVYLVARSAFHESLAGPKGYGFALYGSRSLATLQRHHSLVVPAETSCEWVTQQILSSGAFEADEVLVQYRDGFGTVAIATVLDHLWGLSHNRAERLDSERRRLHALVDQAHDLTLVIDRHGALKWSNLAERHDLPFANLLDGVRAEDIGAAWDMLTKAVTRDEPVEGEFAFRFGTDPHRLVAVTLRGFVDDPAIGGIVVTMRDIQDERRTHNELVAVTTTDALTGLVNRQGLLGSVDHAVANGERPTLLVLDLDAFAVVNDRFGRTIGDSILQEVGRRLRASVPLSHTIARIGGDSFAVAAVQIADDRAFGEVIQSALRDPIEAGSSSVRLNASIGVATMTNELADAAALADQAALALEAARQRGRNNVAVFEQAMEVQARQLEAMRGRLHVALTSGAFNLVYQPQMALGSRQPLRGFEALLRWPDSTRGSIPPNEFIPLAEETGEIIEIGRWVMTGALDQLAEWHRFGARLTMAVNTSVRELAELDFAPFVQRALEDRRIDPSMLEVEITETALVTDDAAVLDTLSQLRDLGVGIAVDDYGAGHASISYLRRYPISTIKVDRTLVAMLEDDPGTASALLRSMTDVAEALGLRSVIEGLETAEQTEHARELGFDLGQGWHCGMPMSALRASKLVAVARRDDSTLRTEEQSPDLEAFGATLDAFDDVNALGYGQPTDSSEPTEVAATVTS